jgi:hypothetical protein
VFVKNGNISVGTLTTTPAASGNATNTNAAAGTALANNTPHYWKIKQYK